MMKRFCLTVLCIMWVLACAVPAAADEAPISEATQECLDCHSIFNPGIVEDWQKRRQIGRASCRERV